MTKALHVVLGAGLLWFAASQGTSASELFQPVPIAEDTIVGTDEVYPPSNSDHIEVGLIDSAEKVKALLDNKIFILPPKGTLGVSFINRKIYKEHPIACANPLIPDLDACVATRRTRGGQHLRSAHHAPGKSRLQL